MKVFIRTMDDFNTRYQEIRNEKGWKPEVVMPDHEGVLKDIVPFINASPSHVIQCLALGFPKNASFRFNGYIGEMDQERITTDLCQSAFGSGSKIRASKRSFKSKDRTISIDFFCIRHKRHATKVVNKFKSDSIQAVGTIIQNEHQKKSTKGKRLKSNRVEPEEESVSECSNTSKKRKTTSSRPICNEKCCNFGFTIFLCSKCDMWYLLRNTRYVFLLCVLNVLNHYFVFSN